MINMSIAMIKTLMASVSALTIMLSTFLIALIFNMWTQDGIPPFENIKFSVALFFTVIILLVICVCLKFFMDMTTDSRRNQFRIKNEKNKRSTDDVRL